MRSFLNNWIAGLVFCLAVGAAHAQETDWIYVGQAENFDSAQDLRDAFVCAHEDWLPWTADIGSTAGEWPITYMREREMNTNMLTVMASGGLCNIAVMSRSAFEGNASMVEFAIGQGFVELNSALVSISDGATPEAPSAEALADLADEVVEQFSSCESNSFQRSYYHCDCLADIARGYAESAFRYNENAREYASALRNRMQENSIRGQCINEEGIGEFVTRMLEIQIRNSVPDPNDRRRAEYEAFEACVIEENVSQFRENPDVSDSEDMRVEALLRCTRRFR